MADPALRFIRWLDPEKRFAVFEYYGTQFVVPRSRIIPHPVFEYTHPEIKNPNLLAETATESNSVFGIPIFRWFMHKLSKGNLLEVDEDDWEAAYYFPPKTDFSCVRDCILRGGDVDICIAECSNW